MERRSFLKTAGLGAMAGTAAIAAPVFAKGKPDTAATVALSEAEIGKLERIKVDLVAPPFVHKHEQSVGPAPRVVEFTMSITEKKIVIDDDGTTMQAMMFGDSMPGPTMVVHEGDYLELTLINPASNEMPHNIDFHASTGALVVRR